MKKTIIEKVYEMSSNNPNKVAVITDMQEITYGELFYMVSGYCSFLRSIGVKKNDIIIVRASQTIEYVVVYLAIHLSGAIVVAMEKNAPFWVIEDVSKMMNASVIITNQLRYDDTTIEKHDILECAKRNFDINSLFIFPSIDSIADIVFTTGTTGKSKGVMLTHGNLVSTAENLIYGCQYTSNTTVIVPGPLNHSNAIRKLQVSMYCGGAIYLLNGMLSIEQFFKALSYPKGKIACCLPPAMIRKIFQMTEDRIGQYKDKIVFIESASSPLLESDKERLCNLLPDTRLYNNYGSTESASTCMYDYNLHRGKKNCVGKIMPNSIIFIVDDNRNKIVSSYENPGLIACGGSVNMIGYYNDDQTTKEVMIDGIIYTNDIGYIDEEGFLYVLGRKDDVINVGGFKVSPVEVENVVMKYMGIDDCICIAASHPTLGKVIKLLYVEKERIDIKELNKYLLSMLSSYMVPQYYESVNEIKKTYNGKVDRKAYK